MTTRARKLTHLAIHGNDGVTRPDGPQLQGPGPVLLKALSQACDNYQQVLQAEQQRGREALKRKCPLANSSLPCSSTFILPHPLPPTHTHTHTHTLSLHAPTHLGHLPNIHAQRGRASELGHPRVEVAVQSLRDTANTPMVHTQQSGTNTHSLGSARDLSSHTARPRCTRGSQWVTSACSTPRPTARDRRRSHLLGPWD